MSIFTTAKVSPTGKLNPEDLKKIGWNILLFAAPTLAVFFTQLSLGVHWKMALPVALLAFWSTAADFFKKLKSGN